ncbi:MAG: type II toxin-antitoxin system RelE/ParE family toxin [Bdellovibrionales bacterium]
MKSNIEFFISPEARNDIKNILSYTTHEWGEKQADIYMEKIWAGLQILLDHPQIGKTIDHIFPHCRLWNAEKHYVVYRIKENQIEIVRFLHLKSDLSAHL